MPGLLAAIDAITVCQHLRTSSVVRTEFEMPPHSRPFERTLREYELVNGLMICEFLPNVERTAEEFRHTQWIEQESHCLLRPNIVRRWLILFTKFALRKSAVMNAAPLVDQCPRIIRFC